MSRALKVCLLERMFLPAEMKAPLGRYSPVVGGKLYNFKGIRR
ncbi:hypothetical protein Gbem_1959 [Citrifermentans bemidjiense Bem]|uniref:Uncharacterized protein n=1 Tax=Citrifermentans bemidjiense (strain ATCC BAA-1014 / DSM 16622 / JCM 12645 / Bem) TaxID=404380 RepID=B5EBU9_CITBB|nr:hypothetical protein Gbem_1959 [Citrifermentans bemidjiense Bem]